MKRINQNEYRIETSVGNACKFVAIAEAAEALPFEKPDKRVYKTIKNNGVL
jgi:hypothetical protein